MSWGNSNTIQHLTRPELREVLRMAKDRNGHHWLMILVAYWHGLRASELCNLRVGDLEEGHITVKRLKRGYTTSQPFVEHPDALLSEKPFLSQLAEYTEKERRLFFVSRIQFYRIFRKYAALAGIPPLRQHPHVLRHSIAMHSKGAGIEHVRQWLGHRNIGSTGHYFRVTDDQAASAILAAAL